MIEMLPSLLLTAMIVLTLVLLPYLQEDHAPFGERGDEELHAGLPEQPDLQHEG